MIVQVKVITKASKNEVVRLENGALRVKCTTVPEKGKANEQVIALLSKYYKIPKSRFTILKGKTSSQKTIKIELKF